MYVHRMGAVRVFPLFRTAGKREIMVSHSVEQSIATFKRSVTTYEYNAQGSRFRILILVR